MYMASESQKQLENVQKYLGEIARLQKKYPDTIIVPGVESTPFYYWTGSPFTGSLTANDHERRILTMGVCPDSPAFAAEDMSQIRFLACPQRSALRLRARFDRENDVVFHFPGDARPFDCRLDRLDELLDARAGFREQLFVLIE